MDKLYIDILVALGCGLVSGVLSAFLVNWLRKKPKIEICSEIAKDKKGVFKIKVINRSKYDAFGFVCHIIFTEPKTANKLTIKWKDIPIIRGNEYWDKSQTEIVSSVDPMAILEEKIKQLPEEANYIKQRYQDGKLTVEDFRSEEGNLLMEVIISATNAKSGMNKLFVGKGLKIVGGTWKKGENKVSTEKEDCADTN